MVDSRKTALRSIRPGLMPQASITALAEELERHALIYERARDARCVFARSYANLSRVLAASVLLFLGYVWTDWPINYVGYGMLPYFVAAPTCVVVTMASRLRGMNSISPYCGSASVAISGGSSVV